MKIITEDEKKRDIEAIDILSKITGTVYSDEQKDILMHHGGMCILASAGSGKTTVLTHLLAKRIMTGEIADPTKLLCTTYSKGGATEMETRVHRILELVGYKKNVTVKTMHALYLSTLRDLGYPTSVFEERERKYCLREACKENNMAFDDDDFKLLDSLISYQVNNLMTDAQLVQSYVFTLQISLNEYAALRHSFSAKKRDSGKIDFDDMQMYMFRLLCTKYEGREQLVAYCRSKWHDIYVDEAQDMSRIQYAILRQLVSNPDNLVVIGDDDQCIYQWRGADPSIIINVCADYDISRFVLSTNYRCAGNIVEKAAQGIVHNTRRSDKVMKPFVPGGDIRIFNSGSTNIYEMSKYAYKYIRGLIVDNGVRPDTIAVLSRNNNHLSILSNMLFKDGIHCTTSTEMKLTKSIMYRTIKNILAFANDTKSTQHTVDGLLSTCLYMKKSSAMKFANMQKSSGVTVSEMLGFILKYILCRNVDGAKRLKIPNTVLNEMDGWANSLRYETIENLVLIYKLLSDPDDKTKAIGLLACYPSAQGYRYENNEDQKRHVEGLIAYVSDLIKTVGLQETKQLLTITEQYENGNMAVPGYKVDMTTIHGAKGKEWDHVIIFADDNISFPSFQGINSQMAKGVAMSDVMCSIDEDRRLHYVAMTRARKELVIFSDKQNPGVFMLEAMGVFDYGTQNNAHIVSMAQSGEVYADILAKAEKELFSKDSKYYNEMDVSDLQANIDIDFLYMGKEPERRSISIDDIQTV